MERSLEGSPRPAPKRERPDITSAGRRETGRLKDIADMRQMAEEIGAATPRGLEKKTRAQRSAEDNAERLHDLAALRQAGGKFEDADQPAWLQQEGPSFQEKDLAHRDAARDRVESRMRMADKNLIFARTAREMLRNKEMTPEEYALLNIDESLLEQEDFENAMQTRRNAERQAMAKGRAEKILERGKQRAAKEGKEHEYVMLDEDAEVEPTVAEKKRRLADLIAERDARRTDQDGEQKKTG